MFGSQVCENCGNKADYVSSKPLEKFEVVKNACENASEITRKSNADLIIRQDAIDTVVQALDMIDHVPTWVVSKLVDALEHLPSAEPKINNTIHLCDSCQKVYPECDSTAKDVIFGTGAGNDNICACACYEPSAERKGKWIEDDDATVRGHCSSCGWESHYYEDDVIGMPFCPNCGASMVRGEEDD